MSYKKFNDNNYYISRREETSKLGVSIVQNSAYKCGVEMPSLDASKGMLGAAMPILLLMTKLKNVTIQPDLEVIKAQVVEEFRAFEAVASNFGYASKVIFMASYCLCTAFDEAILGTVWGAQSLWVQHTLLSQIHKETWGGERFYTILKKVVEEAANSVDMIELLYMLISLGFEGKYFSEGKEVREELRYTLFGLIKNYRIPSCDSLSSITMIDERTFCCKAQKCVSLRYAGKIMGSIFMLFFLIFNYKAYVHAAPLLDMLTKISY